MGRSLRDYQSMPFPAKEFFGTSVNRLLAEERGYDKEKMRTQHETNHKKLNAEQLKVYNAVVDNVDKKREVCSLFMDLVAVVKRFCGRHCVHVFVQKEK